MKQSHVGILLSLLLALASQGQSQEASPDRPKEGTGRYFSKPIDFWKAGLRRDSAPRASEALESVPDRVAVRENVWAQPVRTPDGSWMIYVPPKLVLDFLETPTEESGRAYLAWKAEQSEKLRKAMLLLAQLKEPSGTVEAVLAPSEKAAAASLAPAPADFPFRITYFKKPSCPHCVSQDAVLSGWLPQRPSGTLTVVLPGERPELWNAFQTRGTPTLVVQAGTPVRTEVLVGLQPAKALEAALARLASCAKPTSDPLEGPRKE